MVFILDMYKRHVNGDFNFYELKRLGAAKKMIQRNYCK
jgi:hypothetical protein